jgi:hypothetical protein
MHTAPALLELQRSFLAAVYGEVASHADAAIVGHGLAPAARLRIYRNSGTQIHAEALRTAFPAIQALVGEGYFVRSAARYRCTDPSQSGNLHGFGRHFAEFLESQPETHALPYLGDVARLEWLRQECALAADAVLLTRTNLLGALASITGRTCIRLHPSVRLFASVHPVLTIWRYAVQPTAERLRLPAHGENVVLWRSHAEVAIAPVESADYACLDALARGQSLDMAYVAARAADPTFDLATCVADLLDCGLIVSIAECEDTGL